ncbi:hypothetical protein PSP20601_05003 [Pandoraea sputorum]|nr:hypothetical protein PSP20601_05003 [Pandoraea sputorum]
MKTLWDVIFQRFGREKKQVAKQKVVPVYPML